MKKSSFLIILLCTIAALSCSDEYGPPSPIPWFKTNYIFSSYFIPTDVRMLKDKNDSIAPYGKGHWWKLKLEAKEKSSIANDSVTFKKMASEYGEDGREIRLHAWPFCEDKPYNVSGMKAFRTVQNDTIDISDKVWVEFNERSGFILSRYRKDSLEFQLTYKKLAELNAKDMKWLPQDFFIYAYDADIENQENIFLQIKIEQGKDLLIKMDLTPPACICN